MADERRAMYDGFSDTGKHSIELVWITKEFLKIAFLVAVMKRVAHVVSVRIEGCCRSMRCLLILLRRDLW
jgi:hypothetical protein